jgi:inorganic phosphate transporter, PiT family
MAEPRFETRKETLDKDLDKLVHVEEATSFVARGLVAAGLGAGLRGQTGPLAQR